MIQNGLFFLFQNQIEGLSNLKAGKAVAANAECGVFSGQAVTGTGKSFSTLLRAVIDDCAQLGNVVNGDALSGMLSIPLEGEARSYGDIWERDIAPRFNFTERMIPGSLRWSKTETSSNDILDQRTSGPFKPDACARRCTRRYA